MRSFPQVDHACEWQTTRGGGKTGLKPIFNPQGNEEKRDQLEVLAAPRAQIIGMEQVIEKGWGRNGYDDLRCFWQWTLVRQHKGYA